MDRRVGATGPDQATLASRAGGGRLAPQGEGIGGAMLSTFCERMDQEHALSYLETDKLENVSFYEKFGFGVIEEAHVLGHPIGSCHERLERIE